MATKLQCEICGGKLVGRPGGVFECESCGTEYSTEWAKAKIQEITGTVKVEGTVEVTGKVQVEGGTVQVDTSVNKDALLKRAFMMLADGNWDKADELLEQVLNLDPESGEAYLGKLMAEKKVRTREQLKDCSQSFSDLDNYHRIEQFGTVELKEELSSYLAEIDKNIEQKIKRPLVEMVNQLKQDAIASSRIIEDANNQIEKATEKNEETIVNIEAQIAAIREDIDRTEKAIKEIGFFNLKQRSEAVKQKNRKESELQSLITKEESIKRDLILQKEKEGKSIIEQQKRKNNAEKRIVLLESFLKSIKCTDGFFELKCPHCNEVIYFDAEMLLSSKELLCPCCNKTFMRDVAEMNYESFES